MYKKILVLIFSMLCGNGLLGQDQVSGGIWHKTANGHKHALSGVNVYWKGSAIGTISDDSGKFTIPFSTDFDQLVISHVGFESQTLTIDSPREVEIFLNESNELDEVVVENQKKGLEKTVFGTRNVIKVNKEELLKAACCNLAESFETNPAIDVNFNDALTGTRQIEMLGLTSPYLLITQENIPLVRGASQVFGLTFTPGTWIESIQIAKGSGSVVNGYESITGQINAELVKPFTDDKFFLNGYANRNGRLELNTHVNTILSDKWATGIYAHGNTRTTEVNNNNDSFLDAPLAEQINLMNRWQYQDLENGWVAFVNLGYVFDNKQLGEEGFEPDGPNINNLWGSEIKTNRFGSSLKLGYVFPNQPYQSIGFQWAYSDHRQDSYFGNRVYDIDHKSLYSNLIFNSIIGSTLNKFKAGIGAAYDEYGENVEGLGFSRVDRSIGAFFEYEYNDLEKFGLTAGIRADSHNRLGNFITPRIHLRYNPWETNTIRASFSMGRRAANIFAENQRLFASSRAIELNGNGGDVYGFDGEKAINYGFNMLQRFKLFDRPGSVSFDFYRTEFQDQVVVDWENPRAISFYNLEGKSFANSFQVELNQEILPRLEMRTAYRYQNVETDYRSGSLQRPLQAKNRFFINLGYNTLANEKGALWKADLTLNSLGEQRLPDTSANPDAFRLDSFSDGYSLLNAQVTRVFSKKFEVYLGGENLTNQKQDKPVLGSGDPFGPFFDSTIVYAPVLGTMVYAGFRFKS